MIKNQFTVEQFRNLALVRLNFLESKGFHRAPAQEATTPTGGTVVFLGKHVGFILSLDVRDQCVDAQVVKVQDGQIKRTWEGGYSSNILSHLVKHAGYRGQSRESNETSKPALERMVDAWVELLKGAGQMLLRDQIDTLPI